jgi:hypothetical protein
MIYIEKDKLNIDDFVIVDEEDSPVTGLTVDDFDIILYNPDKTEITLGIIVDEVGNGLYRISFTPDMLGKWEILVYNGTYFPFGKGQTYTCIESLAGSTDDLVKRILGLSQENYRIFNPIYIDKKGQACLTSALIKIYQTASNCNNDVDAIAEYQIDATFDNHARMLTYKVTKI